MLVAPINKIVMSSSYLPLNDKIYEYMLEHCSDADEPVLAELRLETQRLGDVSEMAISPDECNLLGLLTALIGARYAVEVGTFTGSSSISIARGLQPGGKLTCFDQDFRWTSIARRYWFKAGLQDRIDLRLGDAHQLLGRFRPQGPLDLVFIDADKEAYDFYYETLYPLVRPNGLIIFDNMLRGGRVVDPVARTDASVRAIDELNIKLARDPRIQSVFISVADGLQICRKRERGF
jgi:caffeoyl-CoA O-methyltransferase